jgi:hypothetical protein
MDLGTHESRCRSARLLNEPEDAVALGDERRKLAELADDIRYAA